MKNLSLILNAVLAVAVVILFVLHFTSNGTTTDTQKTDDSKKVIPKERKEGEPIPAIVFMRADSVMKYYKFAEKIRKDLETKGQSIQADLQSRGNVLQQDAISFEQNYQKMSIQDAQARQADLQRRGQEYAQYEQSLTATFQQEQAGELKKINDRIEDYVKRYREANGHDFILSYMPTVWGADEALDITQDIIDGLNKEYDEGKKGDASSESDKKEKEEEKEKDEE